jgi:hypothetical protein
VAEAITGLAPSQQSQGAALSSAAARIVQ